MPEPLDRYTAKNDVTEWKKANMTPEELQRLWNLPYPHETALGDCENTSKLPAVKGISYAVKWEIIVGLICAGAWYIWHVCRELNLDAILY